MLCAYMKINNKTCKINKCRKITTTRRKPYFTADGLFHIFRQENISHGASRISLRALRVLPLPYNRQYQ